MKLFYFKSGFKKSILNCYERLSMQWKHGRTPEEITRKYIGLCVIIFFLIGLCCDTTTYIFSSSYLLAAGNILSIIIHLGSAFLYLTGRSNCVITLLLLLYSQQVNVVITMLFNYILYSESKELLISHELLIGFLICTLASLTLRKKHIYILCSLPLIAFAAILIVRSPILLLQHLPGMCLAYFSPALLLLHIRTFLWETITKKQQLTQERQSLCRLMGMNEEQWDLLLGVILQPHAPREQTEKLFVNLQDGISNQLMIRAKRLFINEKIMGEINEKKKLSLTENEIHLCCLIIEDKSIAEISKLLYINESSVRANRSRIRKKIGLDKESNLKAHLLTLIREEDESFIFFSS